MNQPTTTAPRMNLSYPIKDESEQSEVIRQSAVMHQSDNQNQPPNHSQNPSETVSDSDTGDHLADFVVPDIDDDAEDMDAPVHVEKMAEIEELNAPPPELISEDAFFTVFKTAFIVPQFVQPDLHVLAVQPDEEPAARAASDATYGLLKIYYPAALTPKGEVFGHLMIAGPFLIGKVMIVREVLRARQAKTVNPPEPPTEPPVAPIPPAANDNWPQDIEAVVIPMRKAA